MSMRIEPTEVYTESWLSQPWRALRAHIATVVTILALTTGGAALITLRQPTEWAATTTFVVRTTNGATDGETTVRTLASLLKSNAVAADVAQKANLTLPAQKVASEISVSRPPGSGVLVARITDVSRRRALAIATDIVDAFANRVNQSLKPDPSDPTADTGVFVNSWDADLTSVEAVPPPVTRNIALGLMLGLGLSVLAVALREQRAPFIRSASQVNRIFELPIVASLPPLSHRGRAPWNVVDTIQGLLATTPAVGWPQRPQAILVTGPESSGARSALTLAIATAMAVNGAHVVLVDADLEHGVLTSLLRRNKAPGIREFLLRQTPAREVVQTVEPAELPGWLGLTGAVKGSLFLLPTGVEKCDEGELGSIRISALLSSLKAGSVVVIDGPRVPGPSPVTRLLESVDAVLAVAVDGTTRAPSAQATGGVLRALGGPPAAGILLESNRFEVLSARTRGTGFGPTPVPPVEPPETPEPEEPAGPHGVTALPWG